jgi:YidC/Oxa1 family membrane protein insertase
MMVFSGWVFWQSIRNPLPVAEEESAAVHETAPTPPPPVPETNPSAWSEPLQPRSADDQEATTPRPFASAPPPEPPPLAQAPDPAPWEHSFEMPLYHVRLSNRGAAIRSWTLTDPLYLERTAQGTQPIELLTLEAPYDQALRTPFTGLDLGDLGDAVYEVETQDAEGVSFVLRRAGLTIRKQYRFESESYQFHLSISVKNESQRTVEPRFTLQWPAHTNPEQDFTEQSLVTFHDDDVEREMINSVGLPGFFSRFTGSAEEGVPTQYAGDNLWAGIDLKYFIAAILPDRTRTADVVFQPLVPGKVGATVLFFAPVQLPPGQIIEHEFNGYMGPKVPELLEATGSELGKSINLGYGWIAPMTSFFAWLLRAIYTFIPNYGVAIIILTVLVRIVTLPIMGKQMKSMERMRDLQPRVKELQAQYTDDRQKQSEAMMKLYKEEGVNPMGGCLPMLLQFPVFIGLFFALQSSIELRDAPFFGYITDLSAPATLFVIPGIDLPVRLLPILMGLSMVVQQRMTPMTMDPAQARMMMTVMPVMMTVLFYQFPSGLVLYWMVSNLLGIAHQYWVGQKQRAAA